MLYVLERLILNSDTETELYLNSDVNLGLERRPQAHLTKGHNCFVLTGRTNEDKRQTQLYAFLTSASSVGQS